MRVQVEGADRRAIDQEFAAWRKHVDARLDAQDILLREIRDYFMFGKIGSRVLIGISACAAAFATIWSAWGKK